MDMNHNAPQPATLMRQLANIDDVLQHWPAEDAPWLNFDQWGTTCGTYRCLFGDYLHRRGLLDKWMARKEQGEFDTTRHVGWHFGEIAYWGGIFGMSFEGTLAQRRERLMQHRADMIQRIAAWYAEREVAEVAA